MRRRYLPAGLVCGISLVFGGLSSSQEPKRRLRTVVEDVTEEATSKPGAARIDKPASLERRVRVLEKQVLALTRGMEALRKELKPAANQPAGPRPLQADS